MNKPVLLGFIFLTLLMLTSPALGATLDVCGSGCNSTTIQGAIDMASSGDTIEVSAGTYNLTSPIAINKSLTLTGNVSTPTNVVVYAPASGVDKDGFQVKADNVTIQGFNIKDAVSASSGNGRQNAGIMVGNDLVRSLMNDSNVYDGLTGININHNKIEDSSLGVYLFETVQSSVNDNEILRSTIQNQGSAGAGIMWFAETTVSGIIGLEMKRNTVTESDRLGISFVSWDVRNDVGNTVIADNVITGTKYESSGHDQQDDSALSFMWIDGIVTVTNNTLSNSLHYGIVIGTYDSGWGVEQDSWCTGINLKNNSFLNNSHGDIINRYATGGNVNATENWWDSVIPNISKISDNVIYYPFCINAECTEDIDDEITEFDGDNTTNFSAITNWSSVDLVLDADNGLINWTLNINLEDSSLRFSDYVAVAHNRIIVDTSMMPELDQSAILTFKDTGFASTNKFLVYRNDAVCPSSICTNIQMVGGNAIVSVTQMSDYELIPRLGITNIGTFSASIFAMILGAGGLIFLLSMFLDVKSGHDLIEKSIGAVIIIVLIATVIIYLFAL